MEHHGMTRQQRIDDANYFLFQVSLFGRRFFYSERHNRVARFEQTIDGKLWFRDDHTGKLCYTAYKYRWKNFSHGGTMRRLVDDLVLWIRLGVPIPAGHLGPWPDHLCEGDLWGYGYEAMRDLRNSVYPRKCIAKPKKREISRRGPDDPYTQDNMAVYTEHN